MTSAHTVLGTCVFLAAACTGSDAATGNNTDPGTGTDIGAQRGGVDTSTGAGPQTSANDTGTAETRGDGTGSSTTGVDATESSESSDSAADSESGTTGAPIEIDLADYTALGPMETLPAPLTDASGITWNDDTDRMWIVQNNTAVVFEYQGEDFTTPVRQIELTGITSDDTEGLVYLGAGELAVAFESGYGVYIADIPDGDSDIAVAVKQTLTLAPTPSVGNKGLEGIAYDRAAEVFYAVGEGEAGEVPRRFFRFPRPTDTTTNLTWRDAELDVTEPFDADTALPGADGTFDLAGIAFDARNGNVLIVSHTGTAVIQLDPTGDGTILGQLDLPRNQWEGVTLRNDGAQLWVVGEANDVLQYAYTPR